jgi:hypothetical protein
MNIQEDCLGREISVGEEKLVWGKRKKGYWELKIKVSYIYMKTV